MTRLRAEGRALVTDPTRIIRRVDDLPTLPSVVARVNEKIGDPSASAGDINDWLSRDMALSARILKLVNSAYYGFSRQIASVTHAIVILGFNAVRNVTLSASVFSTFNAKDLPFGYRDFWIHSIGVAVAANVIAREKRLADVEDAFMCGLLHDIGKIVLHQFAREEFAKAIKLVQDRLLYEAELEVLQTSHAHVGGLLTDRWHLPKKIVDVIRWHHSPMEAGDARELASAVHIADIFARALMIGSGGDAKIPMISHEAWGMLGMYDEGPGPIMRQIAAEMHTADAFVDMI